MTITPNYSKLPDWEMYSRELMTEYRQCVEEGLDIEKYKALFDAVNAMDESPEKVKIAEQLYGIRSKLPIKPDYPFIEPSDYKTIKELSPLKDYKPVKPDESALKSKIAGAWYGRICGCLAGKCVEGIKTPELHDLLKKSGNFPMHRYILRSDITREMIEKYSYGVANSCYADTVSCAPMDDDTNYVALYQLIVERFGRDFTPDDVANAWLDYQPKNSYCTAERVAFINFVKGIYPPASGDYLNAYREWIGAQIRGDYFGYINPGDPEAAAEMAFRDACISHTKNGIYGEMFASAMIAAAAVETDIEKIIRIGIGYVPEKSRLYTRITRVIDNFNNGMTEDECFADIHSRYDEFNGHDWCHTLSNAEIVAASLLYGGGDYGKTVCMAVQAGFDTDCNGATAGSVLGIRNGIEGIDSCWTDPINGTLETSVFRVGTVKVDECIEKTMKHIAMK